MSASPRSSAAPLQDDNRAHPVLAGWASILFWVCLFGCGGIYTIVYMAPKWVLNFDLRRTERINHQRLVNWQTETARLQKLAVACERDPAFVRELARQAFDFRPADEESIAMPPHLSLPVPTNGGSTARPGPGEPVGSTDLGEPWFLPLLRWTNQHSAVSQTLLCMAGLITVLAFTFLQAAPGPAD